MLLLKIYIGQFIGTPGIKVFKSRFRPRIKLFKPGIEKLNSRSTLKSPIAGTSFISVYLTIFRYTWWLMQCQVELKLIAIERMAKIGAHVTTTESIIMALVGDASHKQFKPVQQLIKETSPNTGLSHL